MRRLFRVPQMRKTCILPLALGLSLFKAAKNEPILLRGAHSSAARLVQLHVRGDVPHLQQLHAQLLPLLPVCYPAIACATHLAIEENLPKFRVETCLPVNSPEEVDIPDSLTDIVCTPQCSPKSQGRCQAIHNSRDQRRTCKIIWSSFLKSP